MEAEKKENINKESIDKEKIEKIEEEKIEIDFSIPDSGTKKESDLRRIELMDEKLAEGTPEHPTQEHGGIAE